MVDTGKLKGVIIVVLLLAALAGFDSYNSYSFSKITGASVADDSGAGAATDQTAGEHGSTGFDWRCYGGKTGHSVPQASRCETWHSLEELAALGCKNECVTTEDRAIIHCGVSSSTPVDVCVAPKTGTERVMTILRDGETKTYTISRKDYELTLNFVGVQIVKFTLNGETSRTLSAGDQWRLADGTWLTVVSTSENYGVLGTRQVEFILAATDQTACTDSDGGKNYYAKGSVKTPRVDYGVFATFEDKCVTSGADPQKGYYTRSGNTYYKDVPQCSGTNCYVAEAFCDATKNQFSPDSFYDVAACPNGCRDGACIPAQGQQDQTANNVKVNVEPGWNIIGINTFQNVVSTTCSDSLYRTVQIYNPNEPDFYSKVELTGADYKLDSNLYPYNVAGWVYDYGNACEIVTSLPGSKDHFSLFNDWTRADAPPWTMVSVPTDWVNIRVGNLLVAQGVGSSCDFRGGWLFYPENSEDWEGKWTAMSLDTVFSQKDVGRGFFIIGQNCGF